MNPYLNWVPPPTLTWKVEGFDDLDQAIRLLGEMWREDKVARNIMVKAAKTAMQPVLDAAINAAPIDEENDGPIHMKHTIRLDARVPNGNDLQSEYVDANDVAIAVVSVKKSKVSLANEFGTRKRSWRPFLRPALNVNQDIVINNVKNELGALIDLYIQKLPRLRKR
jgi:HK97 gp10 family phage protein